MTSHALSTGFFLRQRWLSLFVLTASLVSTLIAPLAVRAVSSSDLNKILSLGQAKSFFEVPDDGNLTKYVTIPSNPTSNTTADETGVVICKQSVARCSKDSPDGARFMLETVIFRNRKGAGESYDFVFAPVVDGQRVNSPLKFVYRHNGGKAASWGLIWGNTNDGFEIKDNKIAGLSHFDSSPLAKSLLDQKANPEGLEWGKGSTVTTSPFSGDTQDPFQQALNKVTEVITSINEALVKALNWALAVGNLSDISGLNKAWMTVRDLINLLFIAILVAMALITMVRIDPRQYSVRGLLPLLVFAVITVNFSLFFAQIMVNVAHILSQPFLGSATDLISVAGGQASTITGASDGNFGQAMVLLLATLIMMIALAILLFFFVVRIIVIWLLAALSPVVLLFMVLPLTRGESTKLLGTWIKWVFMAPIAFLILYIGAQMLVPLLSTTTSDDSGANAILRAIFYAGVAVAAVMLPLAMGGRIMDLITKQGMRAGKTGGKLGFGAAGVIPLGRGLTVGEVGRAGRAYLKQRKAGQEQRGELRAAAASTHLHQALGQGGLAKTLTGLDETQAQAFQEQLVDKELKDMQTTGINDAAMLRIVGHKLGRVPASELSKTELGYASSRIGELAAVKGLSQNAWFDKDMLDRYAWTGYQANMAPWDPVLGNVKKSFRGGPIRESDVNVQQLDIQMMQASGEDMRKVMGSTWRSASDATAEGRALRASSPEAYELWRRTLRESANPVAMRQIIDPSHRNAASQAKREAIGEVFPVFGDEARRSIAEGNIQPFNRGTATVRLRGGPSVDVVRDALEHNRPPPV